MLPLTSLPKVRYPVMAVRMYILAAEPMLEPMTPTMLAGEVSLISLMIENI